MKQVLTAKLKLVTTPEQFSALRATQLAYHAVSRHAFVHGKMSNQRRLQQAMYAEIRAVYRLPAQMACNVPRKARSHLQGTLDEDQEECRPAKGGPDSETLPST